MFRVKRQDAHGGGFNDKALEEIEWHAGVVSQDELYRIGMKDTGNARFGRSMFQSQRFYLCDDPCLGFGERFPPGEAS